MQREFFILLQQYSSLVPARLLSFPQNLSFQDLNSFLIESILSNDHLQKYPPSPQYQKSFWKTAISRLEQRSSNDDDEIDSRILEHYLSLLPPSAPPVGSTQAGLRDQICGLGLPLRNSTPSKSFITHFWVPPSQNQDTSTPVDIASYQTSTLHESQMMIESGTTGLRTWGASFKLAELFIAHPDMMQGKTILELGSGVGFLGIVAATLQLLSGESSSIWLTDVNGEVLSRCQYNVTLPCNLSSSHKNIHYRNLDWFDAMGDNQEGLQHFLDESSPELILGADIIFDPALIPPLVALLSLALRPGETQTGRIAVIAMTIRNIDTFQAFLSIAEDSRLAIEEIPLVKQNSMFMETAESGGSPNRFKILKISAI
ncbi:hypothetical protein WG66_015749 [Moniliophthora roreri]|nr:hypothetical protein WG66_015749 [Moniliophthora roreri]